MTDYRYCPQCAKPLELIKRQDDVKRPTCPDGHFTYYANPTPTAMGFVERDGKFLTLKRAIKPHLGKWDIPGGFMDAGETPEQTVKREVEEETGLKVATDFLIGSYPDTYGTTGQPTINFAFKCHVIGGKFQLSSESSDKRWASLNDPLVPAFASERAALADLRNLEAGGSRR